MERLTTIEQGCCIACFECNDKNDDCGCPEIDKCLHRLRDYENTGLTPEEIVDSKMLTGWVPVEERLPKAKEDVLVCTRNGWILLAWYGPNGKSWHITPTDAGIIRKDIVAWTLLPEPYRPELLREAGTEAGQDAAAPALQSAT